MRSTRPAPGDPSRRGLLTITAEQVSARLAGPAIRALELSTAVAAAGIPARVVSLGAVETVELPLGGVQVDTADAVDLPALVAAAGCVLVQGDVLGLLPWLAGTDVPIVVDAYDPFHLEQLEQARPAGETGRRAIVRDTVTSLNLQLSRADLVLAASARQRDLWLGHLAALGRINPVTYDAAHDLSGLLRVVPFGLPDAPPVRSARPGLRAEFPEIGPDAVVALWAGGLYDWFDPVLVVEAVARLRSGGADVHLVLLGAAHPVLGVPSAAEAAARARAVDLGVLDAGVWFADRWLPFAERADWLLEADLGVLAHHAGVEAEFAYRTRLLDHLWAGLPTVTTTGDPLGGALIGAGAAVGAAPGDVDGFTAALAALLPAVDRLYVATAARALVPAHRWSVTAAPLVDFCRSPRRAPDLVLSRARRAQLGLRTPGLDRSLPTRLRAALLEGGPLVLLRRVSGRLRRLLPGR
ncbi:glycosyltransferase family 1 protein [Nakamurella sp. YIM 132087]|uniref:Glycosyltransferase family 1 protein n=1 Tax=Nakamurella alba TaxID=2665158 RepID=A0A7K1FJ80_9ACTN|nr:glycosyltransferase family 1 protein [Nakamurella alba]MTD14130.1 glycosyltransferase family 1 protein [Nakamurella alba]